MAERFTEIPTGIKYGNLTIIEEVESLKHPSGRTKRMVKVLCDCGRESIKHYSDVKHGLTKTCGKCPKKSKTQIDLTGIVVNRLTVLGISRKDGRFTYWNCKCTCGNIVEVDGVRLRNARVHNCGKCGTKLGAYYIGDKLTNNEGHTAEIVEINGRYLGIVFPENTDQVVQVEYGNVSTGGFANPFARSVFGQGYFGVGDFIAKKNGVHTPEYEDWHSMLRRCYDNSKYHKTYVDVEVYEGWKCYQTFANWVTKQIGFNNKGWHLDKDLLVRHNKLYGPETCVYLPPDINGFIKNKRLNDLPLGVDLVNYSGVVMYRAQGREDGANINLGNHLTVTAAFNAYKQHKEALAKKLAQKWKDSIDPRAYEALLNYTVSIND